MKPPLTEQPAEPSPAACAAPEGPEEVDVWWGSYSSWTMLPSFTVCLLLTGLLAWVIWALGPAGLFRLEFVGTAGLLWLVQGLRWGYRFFGFNYRLTTRRLFRQRGFHHLAEEQLDLAGIARVEVKSNWWRRRVGVGDVVVRAEDCARPPMVLKGLRRPEQVARLIRDWANRARAA
jgi:hypothetical protein